MPKVAVSLICGACLFAAACGSSSSSPSAPSSTSPGGSTTTTTAPATAATTTTTTSGLFTFTFEAGTQVADQALVQNAIIAAAAFYQSALGRSVTQPSTITLAGSTNAQCINPGASAATGQRNMVICGLNQGWTVHNTLNRTKIVTHETFHLVQAELQWNINPSGQTGAFWLIEGSAEYLGWRGVANSGLIAFDTARGCNVAAATAKGASASANLDVMETGAGFQPVPWSYELSMLGVDQLVNSAGLQSLITYGTAIGRGTSFTTAFQQGFNTSTTSFYAGFPAYRASLAGLSSTACGT